MYGEAAILVEVVAAAFFAVAVVLDALYAAVFAVPDGFAVAVVAVKVVRVAVFFEDEGRGLRFAAVLVVVLDDETAIGGFAQRLAVVTACGRLVNGAAARIEVPGLFVAGGVGDVGFGGAGSVEDVFRPGGRHVCRSCQLVDGDGGRAVGFGAARGFGVDQRGGEAKGDEDGGELNHGVSVGLWERAL